MSCPIAARIDASHTLSLANAHWPYAHISSDDATDNQQPEGVLDPSSIGARWWGGVWAAEDEALRLAQQRRAAARRATRAQAAEDHRAEAAAAHRTALATATARRTQLQQAKAAAEEAVATAKEKAAQLSQDAEAARQLQRGLAQEEAEAAQRRALPSFSDLIGERTNYQEAAEVIDAVAARAEAAKGNACLRSGDRAGALSAYDEAVRLDGSSATFWANRAAVHLQLAEAGTGDAHDTTGEEQASTYALFPFPFRFRLLWSLSLARSLCARNLKHFLYFLTRRRPLCDAGRKQARRPTTSRWRWPTLSRPRSSTRPTLKASPAWAWRT